jgi:tetratricopeptide (TPR) repeat protein
MGLRNAWARARRAQALAMLGRFGEARTSLSDVRAELADHGSFMALAGVKAEISLDVELLAGHPAAAVEFGEEGWRLQVELGEKSGLAPGAAMLAKALHVVGRLEEAAAWADRAAKLVPPDDAGTQVLSHAVKAKVLALRGEHPEAERLGREAVTLANETDMIDLQGDALADLAEVLALADRREEAAEALEQALARYERKEDLVKAGRAQARLVALRAKASI